LNLDFFEPSGEEKAIFNGWAGTLVFEGVYNVFESLRLMAADTEIKRVTHVLDVGSGSGGVTLAAALILRCSTLGLEKDEATSSASFRLLSALKSEDSELANHDLNILPADWLKIPKLVGGNAANIALALYMYLDTMPDAGLLHFHTGTVIARSVVVSWWAFSARQSPTRLSALQITAILLDCPEKPDSDHTEKQQVAVVRALAKKYGAPFERVPVQNADSDGEPVTDIDELAEFVFVLSINDKVREVMLKQVIRLEEAAKKSTTTELGFDIPQSQAGDGLRVDQDNARLSPTQTFEAIMAWSQSHGFYPPPLPGPLVNPLSDTGNLAMSNRPKSKRQKH
jgi:hypothetical protein